MWILAAEFVGETVVGSNKTNLDVQFVNFRRKPWKHQLDVHPFFIHVSDARFDIVIGSTRARKAVPHEFREMALFLLSRLCFAQNPQLLAPSRSFLEYVAMPIWRLKDFAGPANPKGNLETLPLG